MGLLLLCKGNERPQQDVQRLCRCVQAAMGGSTSRATSGATLSGLTSPGKAPAHLDPKSWCPAEPTQHVRQCSPLNTALAATVYLQSRVQEAACWGTHHSMSAPDQPMLCHG